jgi:NAD(P)-dependent dehydrogenase (short-subunit alcohol dehydrogenase family)
MSNAFRLDGRIVVVTGAAGIIGSRIVATFLEAGARVFAIDLESSALEALGKDDASLHICAGNISTTEGVKAAHKVLLKRWGEADVLLNNAAAKSPHFFESFETFPIDDWNEVMQVNLTGAMLCAQVFGSPMAKRGSGSIVNTLSIYGIVAPDQRIYEGSMYQGRPINTPAIYAASKAGLWGLTKYLATYWGHRNVRVNAVTPGGVQSGQNTIFQNKYSAKVPLGHMAEAQDIANAMQYLSSDAAKYVTGHNLIVDGGWTAW